jgi:hypothetical protein
MIWLTINATITDIFGGLCLPSSCTPEGITQSLNSLLEVMGTPYKTGSVVNNIQDYSFPYTWVFYLTVAILAVLIGLVIYSTLTESKHRLLKGISLQDSLKAF